MQSVSCIILFETLTHLLKRKKYDFIFLSFPIKILMLNMTTNKMIKLNIFFFQLKIKAKKEQLTNQCVLVLAYVFLVT